MAKQQETMAVSDFNLERINTKELYQHLSGTVSLGGNIIIIGRRGIGKTLLAKQVIAEKDKKEVYVNLSVLERVDMGGYPNIMAAAKEKKYVDFLLPDFYKAMIEPGGKDVVALLDEVDKADPSLWAPMLEFTQFHTINGRALPNLKAIIMTGNLISEGGARPSLPLMDRAEKYLLEADATSWLEWAGKTGSIHPAITAYIHDHPKDLFGAPDPEDRYADPSPRGWHRASDILFKGEKMHWSSDLLNKKVAGCVGKDAGIKYSNYYDHYQKLLPLVEGIFKGENVVPEYNKLEPTKKLVCCMITCARLANQLDEADPKKLPESVATVGKFLHKISYENVLVGIRSQITLARFIKFNLDSIKEWDDILEKISKSVATS